MAIKIGIAVRESAPEPGRCQYAGRGYDPGLPVFWPRKDHDPRLPAGEKRRNWLASGHSDTEIPLRKSLDGDID
jgi:hypothetical protein